MGALLEQVALTRGESTSPLGLEQSRASRIGRLRTEIHSRWPEWLTLISYAALVAFAIPYHEPWTDEAQAWQLARSLPLSTLFQTYIRYEGSPGLWHFLLWILNRANVSYAGMHWICGAIAVAATSILVLKSPFPRYLKLSLPFTYFLLFQYAIVARSYVLVPLLLFMIAVWWKRNTVVLAFLLGLLANVALHAAVISGGLAIVYLIEQGRRQENRKLALRRNLILSALVLIAFYTFAIWTAWPPHDLVIARVRGESRPVVVSAIASLVLGVCQPWILSIPFWFAIAICLRARQSLFYLLPVLLFACFCGTVYATWWHVGLVVPLTLSLLWITWSRSGPVFSPQEAACSVALIVMVGVQLLWSAYAIRYDHSRAYSPDLAAARFLKPLVGDGATIAVTYLNEPWVHAFQAVGILPYFEHNIYINQPDSFWWWSERNRTEDLFPAALRSRPRIVLVELRQAHPGQSIQLTGPQLTDPKIDLLRNQAGAS
jgi:hypothetical protein